MRYDIGIAWRDLRTRWVATAVAVLVVGVAIALSVAVTHLDDGLRRGIVRASDPFGVLVVGAKGSAQQLVLSTLLLQGTPVGNIPEDIHEELSDDPRVTLAVPLAFGDNVGGARVIGTDEGFFELAPALGESPSFTLAEGRLFEDDFEAVLGSDTASDQGLAIGDEFAPAHGVEPGLEEDVHDRTHRVVGILEPSQTAFDDAILATIDSVQQVHAEEEATLVGPIEPDMATHAEDAMITAILVRPTDFVEANEIWQEFYVGTEAQAAFPGAELGGVFDLLDQARELLLGVGWLAAFMAALTLFLAVFGAGVARERLLATMRALGASRLSVSRVVLFEALLIALAGALLGRLLGYAAAALVAGRIAGDAAVPVSIAYLPVLEPWLWALPIGVGLLAGAVPAWQAYRAGVLDRIAP
jgi:putative ABC transport system permease protein